MAEDKYIDNNQDKRTDSTEDFDMFPEKVAIRHYLLKESVREPNVEVELKRFHQNHNSKYSRKSTIAISALLGAAATLLLVFLIQKLWVNEVQETPVTVFLANRTNEEVTLQNSNGDVLSLGNVGDTLLQNYGAKINSVSKTLLYQTGLKKSSSMQTLTTPRKKDFKVILSDGTQVWLNAESQMSYLSSFEDNQRVVYLRGEAYFKVSPDKKRPFIVKTENIQTLVLGTEFNLRNYSATDIHITLVHGALKVSNHRGENPVNIKPGQDAFLKPDGSFAVKGVELEAYTEWKDGYFYFDNKPLIEVMQDIGRWYDVDIIFEHQHNINSKVHFVANRKGTLYDVIDLLNSLHIVKASLKDKKVVIE
ncbi:MAG: FecR domain-containing protein [Bacteroides sp.]|jgi:hypothetical protein|nr:FecR domain-containing protein [Bacteroides sp.]